MLFVIEGDNMKPRTHETELKPERVARRKRQRALDRANEERNRQRSVGGGQPNELGVTQGQNGEQGNTMKTRNTKSLGRSAH